MAQFEAQVLDHPAPPISVNPEIGDTLPLPPFTLQTPQEFRDDFVTLARY